MSEQLDTALIIGLTETIKWGAALPAPDTTTGRMTQIVPGEAFNVLNYARRDREFQHRDNINAAAVAKVAVHAQTVWSGTVVSPRLQGVTGVTDYTGTNVQLLIDTPELNTIPISSTSVYYVDNTSIPYDAIRLTDKGLYGRDALIYETLARAAAIFSDPPINQNDPGSLLIGETSAWATAQGVDTDAVPNAAQALNPDLFKGADKYLAERDNQVAAYAARVAQALKNPFEYASRIYVAIGGTGSQESETYVLTDAIFVFGQTYAANEEVRYDDTSTSPITVRWYRANYTTSAIPGGAEWTSISPTLRQYLAEPALSSRNRIVYNITNKTLQWYRESLNTVHVPQIVGFIVPGILPGQTIDTLTTVPERKDAQFYRQKAARVSLATGTWESIADIQPTSGNQTSNDGGALDTLFQSAKAVTLMAPSSTSITFTGLTCQPGSYAMTALVRPSSTVSVAGSDLDGGVAPSPANEGINFTGVGTTLNYNISLPAGSWQMRIEFANDISSTAETSYFGIRAQLGSAVILSENLPTYYTDANGNYLPKGTLALSPYIDITSLGDKSPLTITWVNGSGLLHIRRLVFSSNDNTSSHYVMEAAWKNAVPPMDYTAKLDVVGLRDVPDIMPFSFYVSAVCISPQIDLTWKTASGTPHSTAQRYYPGDQVLYLSRYWEASAIIEPASQPPGSNTLWVEISREPQIPLIIEDIHLQHWRLTTPTPMTEGFAGFRQDMMERANRSDQDYYRAGIASVGTNYPEFRIGGTSWGTASTDAWMRFQEVYNPRLREALSVITGNIVEGRRYQVTGSLGATVVYNSITYQVGDYFDGVSGQYTFTGSGTVNQIGAYRKSMPGDVGQPALVPAGLEFVLSAGTIAGWYASYASYPTIQALQPWMVETGIHVAQPDFWSPTTM